MSHHRLTTQAGVRPGSILGRRGQAYSFTKNLAPDNFSDYGGPDQEIIDNADYPVLVWDGTTFFVDADGNRTPSSDAGKLLLVVGPGTNHALPFDRSTYTQWLFAVEQMTATADGGKIEATSGSASSSGTYTTEGGGSAIETVSVSPVTATVDPLLPPELMFGISNDGEEDHGPDALFSTRAQRPLTPTEYPPGAGGQPAWVPAPFEYQRAAAPEDNLSAYPPWLYYREDTETGNDISLGKLLPNGTVDESDDSIDTGEETGATAQNEAAIPGSWSLDFSRWLEDVHYAPAGGGYGECFWLPSPVDFRVDAHASATASGDDVGYSNTRVLLVSGWYGGTLTLPPDPEEGEDGPTYERLTYVLRYELAPGVFVVGEFYASQELEESLTGSGVTAGSIEVELPEITITPTKYFTYGGKWSATTGGPA